jgi:hypothetical protein
MKLSSSLSAIVLAATLTNANSQPPASSASMTQEQKRARIMELCKDPNFEKHLVNPKNTVCEYSIDNGKTWKEYIPNGTVEVAGGLVGLLALLGAGTAIMRYRKKDKKVDTRAAYLAALKEVTNKWVQKRTKSDITPSGIAQEELIESVHANMDTNTVSWDTTTTSLEDPNDTTWDWDEVERILAEEANNKTKDWMLVEGNEINNIIVDTPGTVVDKIGSAIQDIPDNKWSEVDELPLIATIEPEISSAPINAPDVPDNRENIVIEDELKEKLQSAELSEEEKLYISRTSLSILKMVKTNIEKRYGFKIDDNDAKITLTAITEWAKLFHLDDDQSILEKQDFSTDWVAQFRRLWDWYFQIVHTAGKTQNIYLVELGK